MTKFFHENSICIKIVDFRHEKCSYGEFCIENVQRDVIQHKLALCYSNSAREIDFDKLCSFSSRKSQFRRKKSASISLRESFSS